VTQPSCKGALFDVFGGHDRCVSIQASKIAPCVESHYENECLRVVVRGRVEGAAAAALAQIWRAALQQWPRRLELDLSEVDECTPAGVDAITQCLEVGRRLDDGVGFVVATDAGRRALLASMAAV
jgi:hypothetical protein